MINHDVKQDKLTNEDKLKDEKKNKNKEKELEQDHENRMGSFDNFPQELLVHISNFLKTPGQLGIFAQLNKACNQTVQGGLSTQKQEKQNAYLNMQFDVAEEGFVCFIEGRQYIGSFNEACDTVNWEEKDETDSVKIKMQLSANDFDLLLLEDGSILGRTFKGEIYFPCGLKSFYESGNQWQKIHSKEDAVISDDTTENEKCELQRYAQAARQVLSNYDATSAGVNGSSKIDNEIDSLELPLITQIAACEWHLLALSEHGELYTLGEKIDEIKPYSMNHPDENPKWLHITELPPIKQIAAYYDHNAPCSFALSEQGVHVRGLLPDPGLVRRPTFYKLHDPKEWRLYPFENPVQMAVCRQGVFVLLPDGAVHRIDRTGKTELIKNLPAPAHQIITNGSDFIALLKDGTIWIYGNNLLLDKKITPWSVFKETCINAYTRSGSSADWMQLPIETSGTILKIGASSRSIFLYTTEGIYYAENLGLKEGVLKKLPLPLELQHLEKTAKSLCPEQPEPEEPTPSSNRCILS